MSYVTVYTECRVCEDVEIEWSLCTNPEDGLLDVESHNRECSCVWTSEQERDHEEWALEEAESQLSSQEPPEDDLWEDRF